MNTILNRSQNPLLNPLLLNGPRLIASRSMTEEITVQEGFTTGQLLCNLLFRLGYPWRLSRTVTYTVPSNKVLVSGNTYMAHPAMIERLHQILTDRTERERLCTCHPDDRPAGPCRRRYAASECQATPTAEAAR